MLQVFVTPEYLAIAMEYAAGGDMFQLVVRQRGLPETDARWYFQQLIIAIDYCHRMVCALTSHQIAVDMLTDATHVHVALCLLQCAACSVFCCM